MFKGYVYHCFVDYYAIDFNNIVDIHKYSMKNYMIQNFGFIKEIFVTLLCFGGSLPRKYIYLNNGLMYQRVRSLVVSDLRLEAKVPGSRAAASYVQR